MRRQKLGKTCHWVVVFGYNGFVRVLLGARVTGVLHPCGLFGDRGVSDYRYLAAEEYRQPQYFRCCQHVARDNSRID